MPTATRPCPEGGTDCDLCEMDYPWCAACREHHRAPGCPIDGEGYSLARCGCRWTVIDADPDAHTCGLYDD